MKLFDELEQLLNQQTPFVCYVKPEESHWNLLVQQTTDVIAFSGQSGFVFVPFDTGVKIVVPFEGNLFIQGTMDDLEKYSDLPALANSSDGKKDFENLVDKGLFAIEEGSFDKVVLSRKIVLTTPIQVVATFQNLLFYYSTAFRYVFYHPNVGLWMGASPEQLVKINQNKFETVALAGTQLYAESVNWNTKEIEEQQFVTDYIVDKVSEKVQDVLVSDRKTVKAGNLAHLKAVVSGNLSSQFTALDLVNTLHPTPAVCGLPKESAIDFILKNEGYDRSYYSGFLGEWNIDELSDLFVNLRCMEVAKNSVTIFVGCGITKDSNPESEFIETENKSLTMKQILVFE